MCPYAPVVRQLVAQLEEAGKVGKGHHALRVRPRKAAPLHVRHRGGADVLVLAPPSGEL